MRKKIVFFLTVVLLSHSICVAADTAVMDDTNEAGSIESLNDRKMEDPEETFAGETETEEQGSKEAVTEQAEEADTEEKEQKESGAADATEDTGNILEESSQVETEEETGKEPVEAGEETGRESEKTQTEIVEKTEESGAKTTEETTEQESDGIGAGRADKDGGSEPGEPTAGEIKEETVGETKESSAGETDKDMARNPEAETEPEFMEDIWPEEWLIATPFDAVRSERPDIIYSVSFPTNTNAMLDPGNLSGRGQIFSERYEVENYGNTDVAIKIRNICVEYGSQEDRYELLQEEVTDQEAGVKKLQINMVWEGGLGDTRKTLSVSEGQRDEWVISLKAAGPNENGETAAGDQGVGWFYFTGTLNSDPYIQWEEGELLVSFDYEIIAIEDL